MQAQQTKPIVSPSYPSINLRQALQYVAILREHLGRSEEPVADAIAHLKFDFNGGKGKSVYAVLKAYSLVTVSGQPGNLKLGVSELARELLDAEGEEPRYTALLEKAMASPKVFNDILHQVDIDISSDESIREYLIVDLGFSADGADKATKAFRETLQFVRNRPRESVSKPLFAKAAAPANAVTNATAQLGSALAVTTRPAESPPPAAPPAPPPAIDLTFPLKGENRAARLRLDLPNNLNATEVGLIKAWISYALEEI